MIVILVNIFIMINRKGSYIPWFECYKLVIMGIGKFDVDRRINVRNGLGSI